MIMKDCIGFRYSTLALACVFLPQLSATALAVSSEATLEEVLVTAAKREQRLQDFTGSVSVINEFSMLNNLSDLAGQVPGLSVLDAGPRNPTGIIMRGLRMDEVGANDFGGDGASVTSYVDNIPLQGYFVPPAFSLKDLQQIEVVRGPQGTLYGNSSIGGLVRYVTAKPDLSKYSVTTSAKISQTQESDDLNYDSDLVVNIPLISDSLGLRLLLGKTENQGFIDNDYLLTGAQQDINDDKARQARISLLWQATEDFSLASSYHYQKINVGDRQAVNPSFTGDDYSASSRYLQPMEGTLQLASVDATYNMNGSTLTASVNHYGYDQHERADQTDYLVLLDELYYDNSYYTTYDNFSAYTAGDVTVKKDSAELRWVSADDQPLRWLLGAFYSRDDLDVSIGDYVPGFAAFAGEDRPNDLDYLGTQTEILDEYSVYGEVSYDLTPQWEMTLGARHFRYKDTLDSCYALYPTAGGLNCENGDDDSQDSLGKFGARYKFNKQQTIYFTVAQGYKRGGANTAPPDSTFNRFYAPDSATNYELGAHSSWLKERLTLNAALYVIDWDNLQVQTLSEDLRSVWSNAGKAQSEGVEFDLSAQLSDEFSLSANYTYSRAEITETVLGISGGDYNAYDGDRLPGSPRSSWNIGLDYTTAINTATLDASINLSRMGKLTTALNPEFFNYEQLDAFTTANARIGVTLRNWRLGAFVHNIANSRGITGKRTNEWYGEQGKFEYITRPRTVGLSATYHY